MPMSFEDLLAQLRNPGEDGLPEGIYDDLAGEYGRALEGGALRAAQLQSELDAKAGEIAQLKAMNFDLLTNTGPRVVEEPGAAEAAREAIDEDDSDGGINSLFGKDDE